ncbi:MAG: ATP-dependent Clp protease ATP-binding subunit [Oscillospiraceae bacterium]|nr:ATP-dependent Clp protease ATP-binding subunit [Oscillospiraceae bacterium]
MLKFSGFTQKANTAVNLAVSEACLLGHTYIGSEHLLLGILREGTGVAFTVFRQRGVTAEKMRQKLIESVGRGVRSDLGAGDFSPRCQRILEGALTEAKMVGRELAGTEHIAMAMLKESDCYADRFLASMGFECGLLYKEMVEVISSEIVDALYHKTKKAPPPKSRVAAARTATLDKFSRDLTSLAREGKLDPVIGREKEVARIIQILCRRGKNNPCLVGEAGVGKTAVVESLALDLAEGEVPELLKGKRLISIDLAAMVAGTKFRGEFEDRVRICLEEVEEAGNVILFIDEIHTIIGAGAAEGAIDAANILKPRLARGTLQLIGATTRDEYRKHLEKDPALVRRFQTVEVEEPLPETALEILQGLRPRYEKHHRVRISDLSIEAAVKLSSRYLPERRLPDKAIDLIDEAAARLRLKDFTPPEECRALENSARLLREEKESAVSRQDFEQASQIRDRELQCREQLALCTGEWKQRQLEQTPELLPDHIAELVASMTGIDVNRLTEEQSVRLMHLEETLHRRVIGQDRAVQAISRAIRRSRVGLGDPKRPIGSFLFLGPTGVGKTELSKALAEALFADEKAMIRIDMSEYMERHSVSRLIGSPPGYVGFGEGGQLTEKVRQRPFSVVLFDEIEKAHCDVFNLMLQILEDGILTDAAGRQVDFKNCILIMTSNIGAREIASGRPLGFASGEAERRERETEQIVMGELKKSFRPEFLNRIDEIIIFHYLSREEITAIAENMLTELSARLGSLGIEAEFSSRVAREMASRGFQSSYGARPLRRAIQEDIEDTLAEGILAGDYQKGDRLYCDYDERFIVNIQS